MRKWFMPALVILLLAIPIPIILCQTGQSQLPAEPLYEIEMLWSDRIQGLVNAAALLDFDGDGYNDVVCLGHRLISVVSGRTGAVIASYEPPKDYKIYYVIALNDTDDNGYNELAIFYISFTHDKIVMNLCEPATRSLKVSQEYGLGLKSIIPIAQNGIINYTRMTISLAVSGSTGKGYGGRIFTFDLTGKKTYPVIENDRIYTIFTNLIPSDVDADGVLEYCMRYLINISTRLAGETAETNMLIYRGGRLLLNVTRYDILISLAYLTCSKPDILSLFITPIKSPFKYKIMGIDLDRILTVYELRFEFVKNLPYMITSVGKYLVFTSLYYEKNEGRIELYDHRGRLAKRFVIKSPKGEVHAMGVGDVDGDGNIEILVACGSMLTIYDIVRGVKRDLAQFNASIMLSIKGDIRDDKGIFTLIAVTPENERYVLGIKIKSVLDVTPPEMKLVKGPKNNSVIRLANKSIDIAVKAYDPDTNVSKVIMYIYRDGSKVMETPMRRTAEYSNIYRATIKDLEDGSYKIVIRAFNGHNYYRDLVLNITVDNTPPKASIVGIEPPKYASKNFTIELRVTEPHLDDIAVDVGGGCGVAVITYGETIIIYCDISECRNGPINTIITITDKAGNSITLKTRIIKDDVEPQIIIEGLPKDMILGGLTTINVTVKDYSPCEIKVYVGDKLVGKELVEPNVKRKLVLDLSKFPGGTNIMTIKVVDSVGLTSSKTFNIKIDNEPPLINVYVVNGEKIGKDHYMVEAGSLEQYIDTRIVVHDQALKVIKVRCGSFTKEYSVSTQSFIRGLKIPLKKCIKELENRTLKLVVEACDRFRCTSREALIEVEAVPITTTTTTTPAPERRGIDLGRIIGWFISMLIILYIIAKIVGYIRRRRRY